MGRQAEGLIGAVVDRMIRRAVRKSFRHVWWIEPAVPLNAPVIFVPNHHGWHDGYVMYHAISKLGLRTVDWVQELDSFPFFRSVGGLPFPAADATERGATVRQSIRLMLEEKRSLLLFAEGILHRPPELLRFGRALDVVAAKVPEATVIPVAIRYDHSMHQRPEAFVTFGSPVERGDRLSERTRLAVKALLDQTTVKMHCDPEAYALLVSGTRDINERWGMRRGTRGERGTQG